MPPSPPLVYVYGIVSTGSDVDRLEEATVLAGATFGPPRPLPSDGLTAVVSDLTLAEGGSLAALLENGPDAEKLVLQHHRVLRALIARQSVLPFRFGALFDGDRGVTDALAGNRAALLDAMGRIAGAVEWGLKIYCARQRLGRWLADDSPALVALEAQIETAQEGKAFFLRRQHTRLVEEETERAIARCLEHTGQRLDGFVRAFASGKLQPAEVHGHEGAMVFNGACLVERGLHEAFFELVDDLRDAYAGFGFDHEVTGPWPPYSFADCQLGGDGHAA